ncbi:MAG: hypothetical protein PHH49_00455 [Candidatus Omnitrophica bacterium]|nr:hypothetical protein [Candidatus Omnitrophota bacterium]MDD5487424.1 hypothetical protein [Candidatus Omnitrophota bacterium]
MNEIKQELTNTVFILKAKPVSYCPLSGGQVEEEFRDKLSGLLYPVQSQRRVFGYICTLAIEFTNI